MALKLILEGIGLGAILSLVCAIGIRNGAGGMVHLYNQDVLDKVAFERFGSHFHFIQK